MLGLRLAAARSEALLTPSARAILEAYAEGLNTYLADHPLPPEYSDLQITSVEEDPPHKIYTIDAIPHDDAPVVWGKEIWVLRDAPKATAGDRLPED